MVAHPTDAEFQQMVSARSLSLNAQSMKLLSLIMSPYLVQTLQG